MDADSKRESQVLTPRYLYRVCLAITLLVAGSLGVPVHGGESEAYRLGAGDEIKVSVYQEDDLSMQLLLDESGKFNYPYLGTIFANDKTVAMLQDEITRGLLDDILINPSVNVSIVSYRNFYIGGEVKSPGGYEYNPGLIAMAGGPTEWASKSKFQITREGNTEAAAADNATLVRPGDTVMILEGIF